MIGQLAAAVIFAAGIAGGLGAGWLTWGGSEPPALVRVTSNGEYCLRLPQDTSQCWRPVKAAIVCPSGMVIAPVVDGSVASCDDAELNDKWRRYVARAAIK
jgi:hypothetical protein